MERVVKMGQGINYEGRALGEHVRLWLCGAGHALFPDCLGVHAAATTLWMYSRAPRSPFHPTHTHITPPPTHITPSPRCHGPSTARWSTLSSLRCAASATGTPTPRPPPSSPAPSRFPWTGTTSTCSRSSGGCTWAGGWAGRGSFPGGAVLCRAVLLGPHGGCKR